MLDDNAPTRLHDPARALRLAARRNDEAKLTALVDWLLRRVPLMWTAGEHDLAFCSTIRGPVEQDGDGFAFEEDAEHFIRRIRRAHEVPALGAGDLIVTVDGKSLEAPLREVVEPESVVALGVWKRAAMASLRRRLALPALHEALIEVGRAADEPHAVRMAVTLLRARASPRRVDSNGMGALHWAARRGLASLVDRLVAAGAPVLGRGGCRHSPLRLAVMGGHSDVVTRLLDAGADPHERAADGRQLIHVAALGPCEGCLELLLRRGCQSIDALSSHGWCAALTIPAPHAVPSHAPIPAPWRGRRPASTPPLPPRPLPCTSPVPPVLRSPLMLAVGADNLPMTRALEARGAALSDRCHGRTPLHHAAASGAEAVLRWLLDERSSVLPLGSPDTKGRTALHAAARTGQYRALALLIDRGASPTLDGGLLDCAADDECKLLLGAALRQWATSRGRLLVEAAAAGATAHVRELCGQGVDPLARDAAGFTALHHAAAGGHVDTVLFLLQSDAGAELAAQSSAAGGALSRWVAAEVATTEAVRDALRQFELGGDERERLVADARRRFASARAEEDGGSAPEG